MEKPSIPSSTSEILEAIRSEKRIHQKRIATLEERERVVEKWLAEERGQQQELPLDRPRLIPRRHRANSLPDFLRDSIADGKPRSNEELAALAQANGLVTEDVDLRTIHSVMMNLQRSGLVDRDEGKWVKQE